MKVRKKKINGKRRISFCNDADITGWQYSSGFVSAEMIAEKLFPPAEDTFVVLCGQYTFDLFLFFFHSNDSLVNKFLCF